MEKLKRFPLNYTHVSAFLLVPELVLEEDNDQDDKGKGLFSTIIFLSLSVSYLLPLSSFVSAILSEFLF